MLRRLIMSALVSLSLVVGFGMPATAVDKSSEPTAPVLVTRIALASVPSLGSPGLDTATVQALQTKLAKAGVTGQTEVSQSFGQSGSSRIVVRQEASASADSGLVQPQFSVGLGWYQYIYLSHDDWIYLAGLGGAAGAAALCWWLTPTIGGAIACAVASYIVLTYVINRTAPPVGYCGEFRFYYGGGFAGYKLVKRTC